MTGREDLAGRLDARLADADKALAEGYPGDRGVRQPVHTAYVPADRFADGTVGEWGRQAGAALAEHGPGAEEFARAAGLDPALVAQVYEPVRRKLGREPVEDLRIDFEDGFGVRPDDEEDEVAVEAARALARSVREGTAAPYHGIRFKCLEKPTRPRALRTLDLVVGELARAGALGAGFLLTLPKVTSVDQVEAMVTVCEWLEQEHRLPRRLGFEIQVETPQSILGADGTALVARMIHASAGRCTGLHYGTYDYSAACGIAAEFQSMQHPAADFAKAVMQVAAAGTGVLLSDGSTNVLPVGDEDAVHRAWTLHARLVRRSLERGFYQGWDLHPAQLPTRFAATYGFYRAGFEQATSRLAAWTSGGDSGFLDEPATARALAGFVLRGLECGATEEAEVALATGLAPERVVDELSRLAGRRSAPDGRAESGN